MTSLRRRVAGLVAALLAVTGCAVPTDDSAQLIEQERLDEALRRVTTTTTSTPAVITRDFAFYLLTDEEPRRVRQVVAPVPTTDSLLTIVRRMAEEGFRESVDAGELINQVRAYGVEDLTIDDGIATVWLTADPDVPQGPILKDAAAQLVWTLTGEENIGAILVNLNGAPQELPTSRDEGLTSDPVDIDDYAGYNPELVDETPPEDPPDESTTTTTTTVPPEE